MRWLTLALSGFKLISTADFLDFGSGSFRSRLKPGTLTANNDLTLPTGPGAIALTDVKTEAIAAAQTAASGAVGLVRSTAAATADLVPVGTTGLDSIAAADAAAGRTAIGLGQITYSGANITGITSPVSEVVLKSTGGAYGSGEIAAVSGPYKGQGVLGLLVRSALDIGSIAIDTPGKIFQMRAEFRPGNTWDNSSEQLQFFAGNGDTDPAKRFIGIGKKLAQIYAPVTAPGYQAETIYTVSSLPPTTGIPASRMIWVSNARKAGEASGAGTGVWAVPLGADWVNLNTNTIVSV
jgi:hypothetical protein